MSTQNSARDAFDAFYSGTHDKCGQLLGQVNNAKGSHDNAKVQHNILLNDYYKSGCVDPQTLLTQLSQAYERHREKNKDKDNGRAKKRDDEDDDVFREDEELSVLRYNQALLCLQLRQFAQATLILEDLFVNIEPIDDFLAIKICFLLLELCLLQREPEQAVGVLAYLEKPNAFLTVMRIERPKGVEPLDGDSLAEAAKACEEDGTGEPPEPIVQIEPIEVVPLPTAAAAVIEEVPEGPLPSLTLGAFVPRHGRPPDTVSRAEFRFFILMYRARLSLALRNTKAAKKEVKNALEVLDQDLRNAPILTPHPHTTGVLSKKDKEHLCQLALQDALQHQHSAMVLTLKAYLEYARQNVRKSVKLLALCRFNFAESHASDEVRAQRLLQSKEGGEDGDDDILPTDFHPAQDEATATVFFNNVGCVHFLMHKPNLAAYYFQKALQSNIRPVPPPASSGKTNGVSAMDKHGLALGGKAGLTTPGVLATKHWLDKKAEVTYNAALQMLLCKRPAHAFKQFEQCVPTFRTWPRLWLRLAECCVEMHCQSLKSGSLSDEAHAGADTSAAASWTGEMASPVQAGSSSSSLVWGLQGSGTHRRWLLTTARNEAMGKRSSDEEENGKPAADPPSARAQAGDDDAPFIDSDSALSHAAMCLRNALALVLPLLSERSSERNGSASGSRDSGLDGVKVAAGAGGATAAASSTNGDKTATGMRQSASRGHANGSGSSSRHQARDVLEGEASLLEDVALVKLSYVSLCQHDTASVLRHCRRFLEKNRLLSAKASETSKVDDAKSPWSFQAQNFAGSTGATGGVKHPASVGSVTLAVMYLVEALLVSGKTPEARALLSSFLPAALAAEQAPAGADSCPQVAGLTPPWHCSATGSSSHAQKEHDGKAGEEKEKSVQASFLMFPATELPRPNDTQCTLYTNLAAVHVQDGNFAEGERCCELALKVQPRALAPLRTLVYIMIRRGKHPQALALLRKTRIAGFPVT